MSNKSLKIILIIMTTLLLIAGVFFFIFFKTMDNTSKPYELTIDEIVAASVDIPEITTNLGSKNYVKIQFKIQTDGEESALELSKRDFQVNNLIIQELSGMAREDLEGKEGKIQLEDSLKTKINELMQNGEIQKVYITSYIIQ